MSKLPNGWEGDQYTALDGIPENRPVRCDSCGWEGKEDDVARTLWEVHKLAERIDPGCITPVGTCPKMLIDSKDGYYRCEMLVYYSDVEVAFRKAPNILQRLAEEI